MDNRLGKVQLVKTRPRLAGISVTAAVLLWFGLLILMPFFGIFRETLAQGPALFISSILTPESLHSFRLTVWITSAAVTANTVFGVIIALVLVTAAIPVQLGDKAWTTIAWAAEGAVLIWLSFTVRMPHLRWYSYVVFIIVAVRLLFFDTPVNIRTFQPMLNERFLAFLVSIATMYLTSYLLFRERKRPRESKVAPVVFLIAANFL